MTATMRNFAICLAFASLIMAGSRARAGLVAYDSFSDPSVGSPLLGSNDPAQGFSGAWQPGGYNASIHDNYTVAPGSLSYGGLSTAGNSVSTAATDSIAGLTRDLSTPLGTPGTTEYLSVLVRPDGPLSGGLFNNFFGLYLNASTNAPGVSNDVFIGKPGGGNVGDYDIENRGGTNAVDSGVAAVTGQTALLVLRMDFTAGLSNFTLYVDPTLGAGEPASGAVISSDVGTISSLSLYSTGAYSLDEIRIGTSYSDVVPMGVVPEPSSAIMVVLGVLGVVGASRRLGRRRKPAILA